MKTSSRARDLQEVVECGAKAKTKIAISNNPIFHHKTKHIKVKYLSITEAHNNTEVMLYEIYGEHPIVDIFIKALSEGIIKKLGDLLGMTIKCLKDVF